MNGIHKKQANLKKEIEKQSSDNSSQGSSKSSNNSTRRKVTNQIKKKSIFGNPTSTSAAKKSEPVMK